MDSRGVDEDRLVAGSVQDAVDPAPGRVRGAGSDRDLRIEDPVDERRLADVRSPDDGDESRAKGNLVTRGLGGFAIVGRAHLVVDAGLSLGSSPALLTS